MRRSGAPRRTAADVTGASVRSWYLQASMLTTLWRGDALLLFGAGASTLGHSRHLSSCRHAPSWVALQRRQAERSEYDLAERARNGPNLTVPRACHRDGEHAVCARHRPIRHTIVCMRALACIGVSSEHLAGEDASARAANSVISASGGGRAKSPACPCLWPDSNARRPRAPAPAPALLEAECRRGTFRTYGLAYLLPRPSHVAAPE